jgi:hypothetical protein
MSQVPLGTAGTRPSPPNMIRKSAQLMRSNWWSSARLSETSMATIVTLLVRIHSWRALQGERRVQMFVASAQRRLEAQMVGDDPHPVGAARRSQHGLFLCP